MGMVILFAACALLSAAAVSDLRTRTVPNIVPLALVALYFLAVLLAPAILSGSLGVCLFLGISLGIVGLVSYSLCGLGGADGKLMAIMGLWAGPTDIGLCLLGMALVGLGLVGIACLPSASVRGWRDSLPYSIAIVMPTVFVLGQRAWMLA